ncbi:hypothetical protein KIH86_18610 [Paenibacillus sp. HN-1]|uniref:hypothetical protein n=1 Tax=Paenibacillus TaxID=44249 RepID=UPI001CA941B7|nr:MULTISPECIES: hypothetical protein [Paenibacillus]MBY9076959.1 hypothetical protein [Paenibacillus sp. CGMCC 1.18879]MBY9086224.1 hypothetical protein [Paenibacillus sinensis]
MAYTRGNLAVEQQREPKQNPRYREKTKVVTRRTSLPLQEKLLYLLTLGLFVIVGTVLVWRYVHIYDLNKQAQLLDSKISTAKKQIAVYQKQKQDLEQQVPAKARSWGWVSPTDEKTIFVPRDVSYTDDK